jgi:predicted Zn-dependent protease
MLNRTAENSFSKGLEALAAARRREALALFEAAIEIDKRLGAARPQPRYLSYYGLCLGLERKQVNEGIRFCEEALTQEFFNPDLCLNLGRLLLRAGRKKQAYQVLVKGYGLQPGHAGIYAELARMGMRRRPVLRFLSRRNPLNVLLGKMSRGSRPAA